MKYLWQYLWIVGLCFPLLAEDAQEKPKAEESKREVNPNTGYPYYDEDEPKPPPGIIYHIRPKNKKPSYG